MKIFDITLLGESTKIRYLQLLGQDVELGPDHYKGDYITDIARGAVRHGYWYERSGDTGGRLIPPGHRKSS